MTLHPRLEHALNTGASMPEVINIFLEHYSAPIEEHIDRESIFEFSRTKGESDDSFWDSWQPLFRHLPWKEIGYGWSVVSEPFVEIHEALTRKIILWICDSDRKSNVYLIAEPPTPAQIARQGTDDSRANFFGHICRLAERSDLLVWGNVAGPRRDIYSLSGELALFYPPFRRKLARKLIDNPGILDLPTRTQFRMLIHDTWKALRDSHPRYISTPPVIVLRWDPWNWDEELFQSICEFGSPPHSPLLWIISLDTKSKLPIQHFPDPIGPFQYFRLPVSYSDGPADAQLILHHRFSALRHKYSESFFEDQVWPSVEQMSLLVKIVSGVFEFVDVIIQFIDWENSGGPEAHLETFLGYMDDSPSPSNERRHCALDHFYMHALSNVPPDLLSVVIRALAIVGCYRVTGPFDLACLLSLESDAFLPYFYRLAVIRAEERHDKSPYFTDFLEDPERSGPFYTPQSESQLHIFRAAMYIFKLLSNLTAVFKPAVRWIQVNPNAYKYEIQGLRYFANVAFGIKVENPAATVTVLRGSDFRNLAHICPLFPVFSFMQFLKELYVWDKVNSPSIVRVEPISYLDVQFVDKCKGLADPLDITKEEVPLSGLKYVLLGFGNGTVLAVLASRAKYSDDYFEQNSGVNIYTSAMLDYM